MRKKGFSLLELMVAVGIVLFLTVVAAPLYKDYANKAKVGLAVTALLDLNNKAIALYNDGQITSGMTSLKLEGVSYPDNVAVAGTPYTQVNGTIFYAPGGAVVTASNKWMFCVYVSGLSYTGYVDAMGGAYSRVCSRIVVTSGGTFTTYCGTRGTSSADVPSAFLPSNCSATNLDSL
ncbi:MAG TPA: prepilin-type N-terminal cleavage/methylation domain-containing protein [Gammaproteobacteria bacterium]|nr:prepilin-type N-terminal cleavage/methylation domain-containing protein [Gammaproteobacteria bacterium]